jgi:hypothetical protein
MTNRLRSSGMKQKWNRIDCSNIPQNSGHDVHLWVVFAFRFDHLRLLNGFFEMTSPWDLGKDLCMRLELEDEVAYVDHK